MTNEIFDNLKYRLKNDPNAERTSYYDGNKYTDPQGNWFAWESAGYVEVIFYAGEKWTRRFDASGNPTQPEKIPAGGYKPKFRLCDLQGYPDGCKNCVFGGLIESGSDCPAFEDKNAAADTLEALAVKFQAAAASLNW